LSDRVIPAGWLALRMELATRRSDRALMARIEPMPIRDPQNTANRSLARPPRLGGPNW
jgi:hypothetical protein